LARIPPGVYADYGVLLYLQGKSAEAVRALTKERELYPESQQFVQRLIGVIQEMPGRDSGGQSYPHEPRSILILPPVNKSNSAEALAAFELTLTRPLVEQGYYVFPMLATNVLLQQSGLALGSADTNRSVALKNLTGADAFLYVTITEWTRINSIILSPSVQLAAEYRLVDAVSGEDLWRATARNEINVQKSTGGPVVVVITDYRIPARSLTRQAITAPQTGLPYGPYHPK
jgi:hypothetical protein